MTERPVVGESFEVARDRLWRVNGEMLLLLQEQTKLNAALVTSYSQLHAAFVALIDAVERERER